MAAASNQAHSERFDSRHPHLDRFPASGLGRVFASLLASCLRELLTSSNVGSLCNRGRQMISIAGNSCCVRRKASRSNRFQRFRRTALPTFRETANPSLGWPSVLGNACTVRMRSDRRSRLLKTASNSAPLSKRCDLGNVFGRWVGTINTLRVTRLHTRRGQPGH